MNALDGSLEYLSAPLRRLDHGVLAGRLKESGEPLALADRERAVHTYVCGMSGSGKSRFLQSLIFQDIRKGHPLCVIDPMGDLYRSVKEFVASGLEEARARGFYLTELLPQYLFLDATDPDNPLRINPLEPQGEETSEELVDDLMKAVERLLHSLEEQRKLRNILRGAFLMVAELNRLPPYRRPPLPPGRHSSFPLTLFFAAEVLNMPDSQRLALMEALPASTRLTFRRQYWEFLALNNQGAKNLILQSSWNVLQYLLDDSLVLRVFDTDRSTVDLADVLRRGQSLFCHLPIGENLSGARFLGKFLTTKLQHSAYRRPEGEWRRPYSLVLDEFHQFVDQAFADAMTNLRKFGLRVTNAHQSQTQPPFDTAEGQALLRTIRGNSRIKAIFRLDRPDAEVLSRELFEVSQRRRNFEVMDRSVSHLRQRSSSVARSSSQGGGTGQNDSDAYTQGAGVASSASFRHGSGSSSHHEFSSATQATEGTTEGTSEGQTTKTVYYTLEGERELLVNALQRLEDRECYVFTKALAGRLVETLYVPDELYAYTAENVPAVMMEEQRKRLSQKLLVAKPQEPEGKAPTVVPLKGRRAAESKLRPADQGQSEARHDSPWEF